MYLDLRRTTYVSWGKWLQDWMDYFSTPKAHIWQELYDEPETFCPSVSYQLASTHNYPCFGLSFLVFHSSQFHMETGHRANSNVQLLSFFQDGMFYTDGRAIWYRKHYSIHARAYISTMFFL